MRILSCYLPATSGRASVAGFDVASQSREVRARVGYMPENVALYPEMRVQEYLEYRAALKGVRGRRNRQRVNAVKELCSLRDVERKLIGSLSKGYRQRVGLADALLHDPDLLILDEPTIGLDPNQIRQWTTTVPRMEDFDEHISAEEIEKRVNDWLMGGSPSSGTSNSSSEARTETRPQAATSETLDSDIAALRSGGGGGRATSKPKSKAFDDLDDAFADLES
jgi:hypothetical protein